MAEQDAERTEDPTPRRRQEAREEGNIARSADLTAACMLLGGVVLLYVLGLRIREGWHQALISMIGPGASANPARRDDLPDLLARAAHLLAATAGPLLLGIAAIGLLAAVSQVGLLLTAKPIEPKWSKISPWRGLKRLFDARAAFRLVMSLAKLTVLAGVAFALVMDDLPLILLLPQLELLPLFGAACRLVYALALKLAALLLVLGLMDYAFQRWKHHRDLRMSKHEVKEELKRMEGDPLIKQRRARVARQLALQRIAAAVPRADVVVTNPTHYAVALRYDPASMRAPKVVAKGADFLAMRIRQLAMVHGVPLVERQEVARALYGGVEIGQEVPPQLYNAVAEILAYVYRLAGRKSA